MDDNIVLKVENLYKKFCKHIKRSMFYGSIDVFRSALGIPYRTDGLRKSEFWALQDISFEVNHGETLGIIGLNGSGKSTLLRLVTGIFTPDVGRIYVRGKVSALIAIGAGFHPHMTGLENIFLNGTILGMTRAEIKSKLQDIIEFAEIGDFIDAPVSTYSSGMRVRLGFSIASHCEPDILIVDEVLSVGDLSFRNKSLKRMREFKKRAKALLFVSHNMDYVISISDRIMVLDQGRILYIGDPDTAMGVYHSRVNEVKYQALKRENLRVPAPGEHYASGDVYVLDLGVLDGQNNVVDTIEMGDEITFFFKLQVNQAISNPRFAVAVRDDRDFNIMLKINVEENAFYNNLLPGIYNLKVTFVGPVLEPNTYRIRFGMMNADTLESFTKIDRKGQNVFKISANKIPRGVVHCHSRWELNKIE